MSTLADHRDELLAAAVKTPAPGQLLAAVSVRWPYESMPSVVLVDVDALSAGALAAINAANTARVSEFEGFSSKERAMDLAVRKRSYVSIAASTSLLRALFTKISSRASNSSLPSISCSGSAKTTHRSARGSRQ